MQIVKLLFAVRVRICHVRGKIRQWHVTLANPLTEKVREQFAHPLEPRFHPARLPKRTEIAKLDQQLGLRGDGELEAIIASPIGGEIVSHGAERKEFAVKFLASCTGRLMISPFGTD